MGATPHHDRQVPWRTDLAQQVHRRAASAEAIIYWTSFPDGDYADPCDGLLGRSIGRSATDLAAAVSKAPGTKLVKGPLDVNLGGHPAKHVVVTVRENAGCDPGYFYSWNTG